MSTKMSEEEWETALGLCHVNRVAVGAAVYCGFV